jgi:hypothetical protein
MNANLIGATRRAFALAAIGALAASVTAAIPAVAGQPDAAGPKPGSYALKDGTTLVVADNGSMRMFTPAGGRVYMKDGVPMETSEGKVVAMKEDLNWKQLRQFGTLSPKSR